MGIVHQKSQSLGWVQTSYAQKPQKSEHFRQIHIHAWKFIQMTPNFTILIPQTWTTDLCASELENTHRRHPTRRMSHCLKMTPDPFFQLPWVFSNLIQVYPPKFIQCRQKLSTLIYICYGESPEMDPNFTKSQQNGHTGTSARCTGCQESTEQKQSDSGHRRHRTRRMSSPMIGASQSKPDFTEMMDISYGSYMSSLEPFGPLQLWWETSYPNAIKV